MSIWNLGSVADSVYNRLDDIPTSYSGAEMLIAIDQRRVYMQNTLSVSIGSNAIAEKYQGVLTDFALSDTLGVIETQGTDASQMKIAEFTISKGGNSSAIATSKYWETKAEKGLTMLSPRFSFSRTF